MLISTGLYSLPTMSTTDGFATPSIERARSCSSTKMFRPKARRFFTDNFRGGYAATAHLIEAGHRRIGHITGPMGLPERQRKTAGFRRAMAEADLDVDEALIKSGTYDTVYGGVAFREIWESGDLPSAIMTTSDLLALSIYQAARELALRIPDDVSIVSFDDLPFVSFLDPPLTTVRQPAAELGRRGVQALLSKLRRGGDRTAACGAHQPRVSGSYQSGRRTGGAPAPKAGETEMIESMQPALAERPPVEIVARQCVRRHA